MPRRATRLFGTPISSSQIVRGLVVVLVDRAPEPLGRDAEVLRQKLPREADRVALEVVAEAEVAEHLEERVMARRVADVLEVVVLAARAHAMLRARGARDRALLAADEHVLELDHAGVREQQRRVVARDSDELGTTSWPFFAK